MSVSQNFIPVPEKKKLKADVNEPVMAELELYLQAAQEDYDWLTLDAVVEQLLGDALKKDRAFRSWLKKYRQQQAALPQQTLPLKPTPSSGKPTSNQQHPVDTVPHQQG